MIDKQGLPDKTTAALIAQTGGSATGLSPSDEAVWIEVIQQMDRVYSELVDSQTALEDKNHELETAQDFIGSVMQAMTDLMIVCDTKGRIEQVNDALTRLTGLPAEKFVDRAVLEVLTGGNAGMQSVFRQHSASKPHFTNCEVQIRQADGENIALAINCSPRFDHQKNLVGMVMIGRPMQELQRTYHELGDALKKFDTAKQHLVASEKMAALGRLVAGVAHELNNPISFIFGNMHALQSYGEKITLSLNATEQGLSGGDMQKLRQELQIDRIAKDILPLVEGTLEGAERVSDIVQDLRRFSGNQKQGVEEFALSPVLHTAANWVLRGAKNKPLMQIDCAESLHIHAQKGYIHQILVNLVQNAVDAMEGAQAGKIEIGVGRHEGRICISVRDNGPGISAQNLGKIFEPFFTTKPVGQGTGLGLYVSYRMADEIGGTLRVENHAGGGSRFALCLPERPL